MKTIMELTECPVIDWELGLKLAGKNQELADELLDMLTTSLPDDVKKIHEAYAEKNYKNLDAEIHRLHGAVSYCAASRLKKVVAALEMNVKQNKIDMLPDLLNQLDIESQLLMDTVREKQIK